MRTREWIRTTLLTPLLTLLLAGCAAVPAAEGPIDWSEANERWSILVVTADPDGDERVTRIWLALVEGEPVFRTNESKWWENLQRSPRLGVRHAGQEHVFTVEFVEERSEREEIDRAFAEKYGWMEALMFPQPPGETHAHYGRLSGPAPPGPSSPR